MCYNILQRDCERSVLLSSTKNWKALRAIVAHNETTLQTLMGGSDAESRNASRPYLVLQNNTCSLENLQIIFAEIFSTHRTYRFYKISKLLHDHAMYETQKILKLLKLWCRHQNFSSRDPTLVIPFLARVKHDFCNAVTSDPVGVMALSYLLVESAKATFETQRRYLHSYCGPGPATDCSAPVPLVQRYPAQSLIYARSGRSRPGWRAISAFDLERPSHGVETRAHPMESRGYL